ncbi:MAG: prepilin-type N-terminal cleavage/methylation domain-containing protein, partial [Butyrivibrio sp.]|nr:prepilin-type N-terminal cleavage/methylation domain-containing protein [Butyrivibrio sp.]
MRGITAEYFIKKIRKRINENAGFTLVELIVVMAIMSILLGVGAWGLLSWHDHSEYIQNEETAKTIFLATQSALSEADSLGMLDTVFEELEEEMTSVDNAYLPDEALAPDAQGLVHEYKYVISSKGSGPNSESAIENLISNYIYDDGIFDGGYIIEFDVTAQSVYGVFYSSWASIEYGSSGSNNSRGTYYISSTTDRQATSRSVYLVGYAGSSLVDMAKLDAVKLRLTQLTLNNEETLNVRFGSNSQSQELDTEYTLVFYEEDEEGNQTADEDHQLFTVSFIYKKAGLKQNSTNSKLYSGYVETEVVLADHLLNDVNSELSSKGVVNNTSSGKSLNTSFMVTYNGSNFELILDAVMDSYMREFIEDGTQSSASYEVANSLSITKILGCKPQNIFVVGKVGANADTLASLASVEYVSGAAVTSETQNDILATIDERADYNPYVNTATGNVPSMQVSLNRHFSNIRYATAVDATVSGATSSYSPSILMASNIDFSTAVVYGMTSITSTVPVELTAAPAFPSIEEFPEYYILEGNGKTYSNIILTEESGINIDSTAPVQITADQIALIKENNGSIKEMALSNATLYTLYGDEAVVTTLNGSDFMTAISDSDSEVYSELETIESAAFSRYTDLQTNLKTVAPKGYLHTAALLCGTNKGSITEVKIDDACGVYAGIAY